MVGRYQPESGDWLEKDIERLPDVEPASWIVAAGDLNADGKDDVAVLGKTVTWLLYQKEGKLSAPTRLMNTSGKLSILIPADVDGDGRTDLCYLSAEDAESGLCARLQDDTGRLGPEYRFSVHKPRS